VRTHPREHDELLRAVFLDELDERDGSAREARTRLETCAVCHAELERLERLRSELSAASARERADLERARAQADAVDEAQVRRALAGVLPSARRRLRAPVAVALASAAALACLWLWRSADVPLPAGQADEVLLDGDGVACREPVGHVAEYGAFAWDAPLPPGATFELSIYADEPDGAGTLVLARKELAEPRWIPTTAEKSPLPDRIVWEVVVRSVDGRRLAEGRARASRR
jgi:hypothetical protein